MASLLAVQPKDRNSNEDPKMLVVSVRGTSQDMEDVREVMDEGLQVQVV